MRARAPSGATPRDRSDRRAACPVVDFRDRAAPHASAHRAPRLESPLTTTSLSPFRASARSRTVAASGCRSRRYKARFNWEHYTHAVAPGTREMLPSETQACASVTSAFLQVRPPRERRALPRLDARACFFFRCFSRTARPLVCRVCVDRRFRNAIVGRVSARPRPRALDRCRSRSIGRVRIAPVDPTGAFRRARVAHRRATPIEAASFGAIRRVAR